MSEGYVKIGESAKADDLTAIGRFGIGFKSVYAITDRPEIHSGPEDFRYRELRPACSGSDHRERCGRHCLSTSAKVKRRINVRRHSHGAYSAWSFFPVILAPD